MKQNQIRLHFETRFLHLKLTLCILFFIKSDANISSDTAVQKNQINLLDTKQLFESFKTNNDAEEEETGGSSDVMDVEKGNPFLPTSIVTNTIVTPTTSTTTTSHNATDAMVMAFSPISSSNEGAEVRENKFCIWQEIVVNRVNVRRLNIIAILTVKTHLNG